jgi:hypothetical protein
MNSNIFLNITTLPLGVSQFDEIDRRDKEWELKLREK